MNQKYFYNLDGFRSLAAIAVVFSHAGLHVSIKKLEIPFAFKAPILYLTSGSVGVSFFFVLSGFLISYLLLQEQTKNQSIDIKKFYLRRVLRIWPLYFMVVFFGFVVYPQIKSMLGVESFISADPVYYFLFLSNFDLIRVAESGLIDYLPLMLGITWSVSIEEQFYLFWPWFFKLLKSKWLTTALVGIIIVLILVRMFQEMHMKEQFYFHTLSAMLPLCIGAFYSLLIVKHEKIKSLFQSIPKPINILIYSLGIVFSVFIYDLEIIKERYFLFTLAKTLEYCFFGYIIVEQSINKSPFFQMKNSRLLTKIGVYTYGLYLLHPIVLQMLDLIFRYLNFQPLSNLFNSIVFNFLVLCLSILLSKISYTILELPFLKLKKHLH